jgi:hypothetical protein
LDAGVAAGRGRLRTGSVAGEQRHPKLFLLYIEDGRPVNRDKCREEVARVAEVSDPF